MDFFLKITASIRGKLFLSFICIAVIALMAGLFSMIPFTHLEAAMSQIGHDNLQSLLRISAIKESQSQILSGDDHVTSQKQATASAHSYTVSSSNDWYGHLARKRLKFSSQRSPGKHPVLMRWGQT